MLVHSADVASEVGVGEVVDPDDAPSGDESLPLRAADTTRTSTRRATPPARFMPPACQVVPPTKWRVSHAAPIAAGTPPPRARFRSPQANQLPRRCRRPS